MSQNHSLLAFDEIRPHLSKMRQKAFDYIETQGELGATCDEVMVYTGMTHQSCSPCVNWLWKMGWILETKASRETRSGYLAAVYIVNRGPRIPISIRANRNYIKGFNDAKENAIEIMSRSLFTDKELIQQIKEMEP